jgi:hypothetical protein
MIDGGTDQWLLHIRRSPEALAELVMQVAEHVAPRPCAAKLRVYGEAMSASHVLCLSSASAAIDLLAQCEAVGVFDSTDGSRDQRILIEHLRNPTAPGEDEACLLRAVQPRPVVFLHAGHDDIDLVCTRRDAVHLMAILRQEA